MVFVLENWRDTKGRIMIKLIVFGVVPSKSNTYRIGRGSFYRNPKIKQYEDSFRVQTCRVKKNTFDKEAKLFVRYEFHVANMGQDSDNIENTINDCLQKCEIIPNDNKIIVHHTTKISCKSDPKIIVTIEEIK
jgi:Holliday junction resolvase RusA-like endonuclease